MHFNIQVKIAFLTLILPAFLLAFSACETVNYQSGSDYKSIAYNDALAAGIDGNLFVKQIDAESKFNPSAISPAGAVGIAQFLPTTAASHGVNPYDPISSLNGAARLMAQYVNKYGDYQHALAAYNCGEICLEKAEQNCQYYYWCLPLETEHYINEVMS